MTQTFILQNQNKHFFGKNKEWVDGYDANALFKTLYKDEAINQMVEISSKDYTQRVKVIGCELNEKGLPIIDADIMPAPLPKAPKPPKAGNDLFAQSEPDQASDMPEDAEEEEAAYELPGTEADEIDIPNGEPAEPEQENLL